MKLTKTIEIDLTHPDRPKKVAAVEGDSYTRQVDIRLLSDSHIPWAIPKDVAVMISYVKPDRTAGAYDTLPDGTQAYSIYGNILSVMLAPQMLTAVGEVAVQIQLTQGDKMLSTFPFGVLVARRIAADAQSEDYFNWRAQYLPQTVGAKVGQWLQITQVDEQGRVLAVEAVDEPTVSEESIAASVAEYLEKNPPGGVDFETDNTLKLEDGVLSVNTTDRMEQDNTLPITSAGVYATVGNIESLLATI